MIKIVATLFIASLVINENGVSQTIGTETEAEISTTVETTVDKKTNDIDYPDPVIERSGHNHIHADPGFKGFWAKKIAWRPRWVKTWQEKKVYVAVWKRMWGPLVLKEWVPVPKPPPGWVKAGAESYIVKQYPHH